MLAAEKLHLPAKNCIVFEDVPKGVEAAANAGMKAIVITTQHKADEFSNCNNVLQIIPDYVGLEPAAIVSQIPA